MRHISERIALTALAALLVHASAKGQELPVLAEVPSIGPVFSETLSTRKLSRDGQPFLVMVGSDSVQSWPLGSEAEPIASPGPIPCFYDLLEPVPRSASKIVDVIELTILQIIPVK